MDICPSITAKYKSRRKFTIRYEEELKTWSWITIVEEGAAGSQYNLK